MGLINFCHGRKLKQIAREKAYVQGGAPRVNSEIENVTKLFAGCIITNQGELCCIK